MPQLLSIVAALLLVAALFPQLAQAAPHEAAPQGAGPHEAGPQEQRPLPAAVGERGVFATLCRFSHEAPDDPIVFPGQPGRSHLHTFFGNATTNATSTYESLRAGRTTCRTEEDGSGYWVPALFRDGVEVKPVAMKVYYRTGRHAPESVQPFPAGFRVVAGSAAATAPQGLSTTFWHCRGLNGLEDGAVGRPSETPQACPDGSTLSLHVRFPECWDGASVDSPDHRSHVAYGMGGTCPASHPVVLPSLTLISHYPINGDPGTITLASGSQYSGHADFFNAWDQEFLARSVRECLNAQQRCGVR